MVACEWPTNELYKQLTYGLLPLCLPKDMGHGDPHHQNLAVACDLQQLEGR